MDLDDAPNALMQDQEQQHTSKRSRNCSNGTDITSMCEGPLQCEDPLRSLKRDLPDTDDFADALKFKRLRIQTFSASHLVAQRRLRSDVQKIMDPQSYWMQTQGVAVEFHQKGDDPFAAYLGLTVTNLSATTRKFLFLVTVPVKYPYHPPSLELIPAPSEQDGIFHADGSVRLSVLESATWSCTCGIEDVAS